MILGISRLIFLFVACSSILFFQPVSFLCLGSPRSRIKRAAWVFWVSLLVFRVLLGGDKPLLVEVGNNVDDAFLDTLLVGLDSDLGGFGGLVRGADTGEVRNLTGTGLLVETLGVTLLGDLDGDVDEDLDEGDGFLITAGRGGVDVTGDLAVSLEGGDEGSEGDGRRVGKELGNFADAADVLNAVLVAEAQVLVQAETDIVAIETVGSQAQVQEVLLQGGSNGRLARSGQTSEPEGEALLLAELGAILARQRRVPNNVAVEVTFLSSERSMDRCCLAGSTG